MNITPRRPEYARADFQVVGLIRKIRGGSINPTTHRPLSAMLTVRYGNKHDGAVGVAESINALAIRVPPHVWQDVQTQIAVGQVVEIKGKIERVTETGYLVCELVVERVKPLKQEPSSEPDSGACE